MNAKQRNRKPAAAGSPLIPPDPPRPVRKMAPAGSSMTVADFERAHLQLRRRTHEAGECGGMNCPYCAYALATGRPRWPSEPTGQPTG